MTHRVPGKPTPEWAEARRTGENRKCPCGKEFYAADWQIKAGKGRFCSRRCSYDNRVRPSGLIYNIVADNQGWIKPGERRAPETEFKTGQVPHNFAGDMVGYCGLHDWVRAQLGPANIYTCDYCGGTESRMEWANKSWTYKRDITDWLALCSKCHRHYDRNGDWGAASRLFEWNGKHLGRRIVNG